MATLFGKLWKRICSKRASASIMLVGLDNSGKTSILTSLVTVGRSSPSNRRCEQTNSNEPSTIASTTTATTSTSSETESTGLSCQDVSNLCPSKNILPTVGYSYERIQYKNLVLTVLDFSGQNRYRNFWQEFYSSVDAIVFVIDSSDLMRLVVVRDELEIMLSHSYFNNLDFTGSQTHSSTNSRVSVQTQLTINQGKLIQMPLDTSSSVSTSRIVKKNSTSTILEQKSDTRRRTKIPILFLANKADLANSVDTEVITKALNLNQLPVDRHPYCIQATSVKLNQGIVEGFDWLVSQLTVVN